MSIRVQNSLQQVSRTQGIHRGVLRDPVHGLADPYSRRQVVHNVNTADRVAQLLQVAHVGLHKFDFGGKIGRHSCRMDLFPQIVVNANLMTLTDQRVCGVRAHKSRPACDQDFLSPYLCLAPFSPTSPCCRQKD